MSDPIPGKIIFNFVTGSTLSFFFPDLDEAIDFLFDSTHTNGMFYAGNGTTINLNNVTTFTFSREKS